MILAMLPHHTAFYSGAACPSHPCPAPPGLAVYKLCNPFHLCMASHADGFSLWVIVVLHRNDEQRLLFLHRQTRVIPTVVGNHTTSWYDLHQGLWHYMLLCPLEHIHPCLNHNACTNKHVSIRYQYGIVLNHTYIVYISCTFSPCSILHQVALVSNLTRRRNTYKTSSILLLNLLVASLVL